ncbi:hypothetical protein SAMN02745687_02383 [Lachnospiraceae bacterium NK3A20]|nr:hypothetical protein SAMN02745687_02383 [Lachnospiraceae bacterium NK3A20]
MAWFLYPKYRSIADFLHQSKSQEEKSDEKGNSRKNIKEL